MSIHTLESLAQLSNLLASNRPAQDAGRTPVPAKCGAPGRPTLISRIIDTLVGVTAIAGRLRPTRLGRSLSRQRLSKGGTHATILLG
jgi:hypothetical protein